MSEVWKSECEICFSEEIDDVLIFRKPDQNFESWRKTYCPKHAKKLEEYLNGSISYSYFIQ